LLRQITTSSARKPRLSAAERLKIQPGDSLQNLYKPQNSSSITISSSSRKSSVKEKLESISEEKNEENNNNLKKNLLRAPIVSLDSDL
jgi:hypothetical protein